MSEIRYNRLEDVYVIIAPERLHRPDALTLPKKRRVSNICPFCEGNESLTPPEIYAIRNNKSFADEKGWSTRVIPNLFKVVQIEAPYQVNHVGSNEVWDGFGAHEIIIDATEHLTQMSQWSQTTFFYWLKTMQTRIQDLKHEERLAAISLFKNHGSFAGATQSHPHTQLIGLPVVPTDILKKYERMSHYYKETGRLLIDDMVRDEEEDENRRIIVKRKDFIAFCPFASQHPFEVMIASHALPDALDRIADDKLQELALVLQSVFEKMESQLGDFDFNMSLSLPPLQRHHDIGVNAQHFNTISRFHIRIMPRLYQQGGFEFSTATMVNPVQPEQCAKLLRESKPR